MPLAAGRTGGDICWFLEGWIERFSAARKAEVRPDIVPEAGFSTGARMKATPALLSAT